MSESLVEKMVKGNPPRITDFSYSSCKVGGKEGPQESPGAQSIVTKSGNSLHSEIHVRWGGKQLHTWAVYRNLEPFTGRKTLLERRRV